MGGPTPPDDHGLLAHKILLELWQAHRDDVLLVVDVAVEPDHGQVVLEGGGLVVGVLGLLLDVVVLVGVFFGLFPNIPFPKSVLHVPYKAKRALICAMAVLFGLAVLTAIKLTASTLTLASFPKPNVAKFIPRGNLVALL